MISADTYSGSTFSKTYKSTDLNSPFTGKGESIYKRTLHYLLYECTVCPKMILEWLIHGL